MWDSPHGINLRSHVPMWRQQTEGQNKCLIGLQGGCLLSTAFLMGSKIALLHFIPYWVTATSQLAGAGREKRKRQFAHWQAGTSPQPAPLLLGERQAFLVLQVNIITIQIMKILLFLIFLWIRGDILSLVPTFLLQDPSPQINQLSSFFLNGWKGKNNFFFLSPLATATKLLGKKTLFSLLLFFFI